MNQLHLYEHIPKEETPVRIVLYDTLEDRPFHLHWHEHLEIHYVYEGTSRVRCDASILEIEKDTCLLINSNELHEGLGGISKYICMILPPSVLGKNNMIFRRIIHDKQVCALMKQILQEALFPDAESDTAILGYAHLLLAHLKRNHAQKAFSQTSYIMYLQKADRFNQIMEYLSNHYTEDISLDKMAKKMHVTKHYFCHTFKAFTGKTLTEYVSSLRIQKAIELLSSTDMPITEISFLCGFEDSNYFSRKFRQITGTSPRTLRREKTSLPLGHNGADGF